MNLHQHYDLLTAQEKQFVDEAFELIFLKAREQMSPLQGDDRAEVAVDALAKLVIESREPKRDFYSLPICRECGEAIEGTSYNFRCGSCAQALAREETSEIERHWQEVTNVG